MAFSQEDTTQKVVAIIADKLKMPSATIAVTATFKDLGMDSIDNVDMIMNFEETFGIEIKDEDAEKIKTVQQAIDLIHASRTK